MTAPQDWKAFYRNAYEAVESLDWERIFHEEGDILPGAPYNQDDEECEEPDESVVEHITAEQMEVLHANAVHIELAFTEHSIEPLLQAWDHWVDHDCEAARPILDGVLELLLTILIEKATE